MTIDQAIASNDPAVMDRFFEANREVQFPWDKLRAFYMKVRELGAAEEARAKAPKMGETCRKCGHVVKERSLFTSTYVGCMC